MPPLWNPRELLSPAAYALRWAVLLTPMALAVGSGCALFLWALEHATRLRHDNPWLLYLLPLTGAAVAFLYAKLAGRADAGNNLILDEIHQPDAGVPRRMAPMILLATLASHLCGASVGREGTAVQMGASLASGYGRLISKALRVDHAELLMCGVAAGFGGVFGTPIAGAVFAAEVLAVGKIDYRALLPCLVASLLGDWSCQAWGIQHTHYTVAAIEPVLSLFAGAHVSSAWLLLLKAAAAGVVFGLVSALFSRSTHALSHLFKKHVRHAWLRPVIAGVLTIALVHLLGTRDYLGLGVTSPDPAGVSITSAFSEGGAHPWSWFWKLLLTALAVGAGFKGGEVTPLFFIGATLGSALAGPLHAPTDLLAAAGFLAVFAGATNTPIACTLMGAELFGAGPIAPLAVACFTAYLFSGNTGIYHAQRRHHPKHPHP